MIRPRDWDYGVFILRGREFDDHQPDRRVFLKESGGGGERKNLSVSHSRHSTSISFLSLSLILTCQISRSFSLTGSPTHNCVFALRVEGGMWAASKQRLLCSFGPIEYDQPRITVCYCKTFLYGREKTRRKGCRSLKPQRHFYDSVLIESVHLFASPAERTASHVGVTSFPCVCVCVCVMQLFLSFI